MFTVISITATDGSIKFLEIGALTTRKIAMFRFIHTADVHLDSPLKSLAVKEADAAALVANATRQSFERTVDICIEEEVDALLIAGDLYDGTLHSMKTAAFFTHEMRRLAKSGIHVYMVRGNHDAESRITKHLELPENVHVFSNKEETVRWKDSDIFLHGVSFAKPHAPESLLPKYPRPRAGMVNIGLLHTSLVGSSEHDVYAPCSLSELTGQGYHYWALGHIHKREIHHNTGDMAVVMPGIPQGRHINEAGVKSVTFVRIDTDRKLHIEERCTSLVQFERVDIDISGITTMKEVIGYAEKAFETALDAVEATHLITRVCLTGSTSLAMRLRRDADVLAEELRQAASRSGSVFIEKIINETQDIKQVEQPAGSDPINELHALIQGDTLDVTNILEQVQELRTELQRKLPPELREKWDIDSDNLMKNYCLPGAEQVLASLVLQQEPE